MSDVDKVIKVIRPSLRRIAPQTYWYTIGFGVFNIFVGLLLISIPGLVKLELLSVLTIKGWALVFILMGLSALIFLFKNNWKVSRELTRLGIIVKAAWWFELLSVIITDHSPYMILVKSLFLVWSLLLYLQIFTFFYFSPRMSRDDLRE